MLKQMSGGVKSSAEAECSLTRLGFDRREIHWTVQIMLTLMAQAVEKLKKQ